MVAKVFTDKAVALAQQYDGFDAEAMTYSGVFSARVEDLPPGVARSVPGGNTVVSFLVSKQQAVIWAGGQRYWAGDDNPVADALFEQTVKPWIHDNAPEVFRFFQGLPEDTLTIDLFEEL